MAVVDVWWRKKEEQEARGGEPLCRSVNRFDFGVATSYSKMFGSVRNASEKQVESFPLEQWLLAKRSRISYRYEYQFQPSSNIIDSQRLLGELV